MFDGNGKKVLVFGSGKSGIGAVTLLEHEGVETILYDGNEKLSREEVAGRLPEGCRTEIVIGAFPYERVDEIGMLVLSPGVPTDLPVVQDMEKAGIPVWGEVELASCFGKGDVLAITGTNGKTTTTTLLGEIMKAYKPEVFVVGNIGNPYTLEALKMTPDSVTVAEISSFQLETIHRFAPKISAILNITPDHLNRHHTMENYIKAKEAITENQTKEEFCVLNYEDEVLREFGEKTNATPFFFSSKRELETGIFLKDGEIIFRNPDEVRVCKTNELQLLGTHNYENVMAAVAMAALYGVPMDTIRDVIRRFSGVEHRIEYVTEKNGVAYYNDSKGTNPDAAIRGITAMNRPTVLIGGGFDKQSEYDEWIESFHGKVKKLILIGETKKKIAETARKCGFTAYMFADTLEKAVTLASREAKEGDAVLLSPACASWDMFGSYEERGEKFKELVKSL